jgi:hypothetical protein
MTRNQDHPVGARVCWFDGRAVWHGVVERQGAILTAVRVDDGRPDAGTACFDPDGAGLWPADAAPLVFAYTNHRGEKAARRVIPLGWWFGATDFHPEPQWYFKAWCFDRQAVRDFDMRRVGRLAGEGRA